MEHYTFATTIATKVNKLLLVYNILFGKLYCNANTCLNSHYVSVELLQWTILSDAHSRWRRNDNAAAIFGQWTAAAESKEWLHFLLSLSGSWKGWEK